MKKTNYFKLPSKSATDYAKGYYLAGNGTINQAAKQACIYDCVSNIWWRLVRLRLLNILEVNDEED